MINKTKETNKLDLMFVINIGKN